MTGKGSRKTQGYLGGTKGLDKQNCLQLEVQMISWLLQQAEQKAEANPGRTGARDRVVAVTGSSVTAAAGEGAYSPRNEE